MIATSGCGIKTIRYTIGGVPYRFIFFENKQYLVEQLLTKASAVTYIAEVILLGNMWSCSLLWSIINLYVFCRQYNCNATPGFAQR